MKKIFAIRKYLKLRFSSLGFGIIEIIVAMGLFLIFAGAGTTSIIQSFNTNRLGDEESEATFYAQEGIEAVRSIKNQQWTNLTDSTNGLDNSGGTWAFSGSSDTNGRFTRVVTLIQAERDGNGDIVASGGIADTDTFKVISTVTWDFTPTRNNTVDVITYLTQFEKAISSAAIGARIGYYDENNKDLKYAECASSCTTASNWTLITVKSSGDVGEYISLAADGAKTAISYFDKSDEELEYAICESTCTSAANWTTVVVDSAGFVGEHTSLAFDSSGNPRVSYYDKDNDKLKFAQCDSTCTSSGNWTTVTVESSDKTGQFSSIAVSGTKVGISYYYEDDKDLRYAECASNCNSSGNWTIVTVQSSNEPGKYSSIGYDSSGNPKISYYEENKKDLRYAECNSTCTSAGNWTTVKVDGSGTNGLYTNIALDGTKPRITYYKESGKNFRFAECDASCTSSGNWSTGNVITTGDVGQFSSMALEDGKPRVSFYDETNKDLEWGSCDSSCTNKNNWTHISVDSSGDVGQQSSNQ